MPDETVTIKQGSPQEITYYYKLKQVQITTAVEGEGGSISGEGQTPYEIVNYEENSVKEIKAVPQDNSYRVKRITVNGVEIPFSENEEGIVVLEKFIEMTENKHVVVSFEKISAGQVKVKHLEFGTNKLLIEPIETISGYVGEAYTTTRENIPGYKPYGMDPINANGILTQEGDTVIYYYKKAEGTVTVKYVDIDTNKEIEESQMICGDEGEDYTTKELIKEIPGYKFVEEEVENETGKYIEGNITVIYRYQKKPAQVIVHYLEKGTNKVLKDPIEIEGSQGDEYDVSDLEEKEIKGYKRTLDIPENKEGTMTPDVINVIYLYELINETITSTIEKQADKEVLTNEPEEVKYTITYNAQIKDYMGKVKIEIVDELPSRIDISKSDIKDGHYDAVAKTITWTETIENIDTYENGTFEKEITKQISIVYEGQNKIEDLINTARGSIVTYYPEDDPDKPNEPKQEKTVEKTETVEQDYKTNKTVQKVWDDNDNEKQKRPQNVKVQLTANGSENEINKNVAETQNKLESIILSEENNWTHTFENLSKYDSQGNEIVYSIKEQEVNEKDLEYYEEPQIRILEGKIIVTNTYKLTNTEVEGKITKQGTEQITRKDQEVDYHIDYEAIIKDYIGEAKISIIDTLPYKIDEEKSNLNGGIYDENTLSITWIEEPIHINTNNEPENSYKVKIAKDLKLVYKDLDVTAKKIKNVVKGRIEFTENGTKNEKTDEHETDINIKGKIIVKYVDKKTGEEITYKIEPGQPGNEDGNEAIEKTYQEEKEEKVGNPYETNKKEIPGYKYVEDTGNTVGTVEEGEITVIYYYETTKASDVIVKYVDEEGNEIVPGETIGGEIGAPYETEEKQIENYEFEKVTGDEPSGTLDENPKEVIYHYKKAKGKIVVKYIDVETKQEITYIDENGEEKIYGYEEEGYVGKEYKTGEKQIPYYYYQKELEPENKEGTYEKGEKQIVYYYKKMPFNISIEKTVKEATTDGYAANLGKNEKLIKMEVRQSRVTKAKIQIKYKLLAKNTGDIEGTAEIQELVPEGFSVASENPEYWQKQKDGSLITKVELKPKEEKELEVVLKWQNGSTNFGSKTNKVQIIGTKNEAGYEETNLNDNMSEATVLMAIRTGKEITGTIVVVALGTIAVLGVSILLYQYKNIKKKETKK